MYSLEHAHWKIGDRNHLLERNHHRALNTVYFVCTAAQAHADQQEADRADR
jgi:hypothetical protein